jgi:hypothetical protein
MNILFSIEEMAQCLRSIGYEVREETEIATFRTYHDNTEEEEVSVINVYYKGETKPTAYWAGYASKRLEYTFQQELKNRMLKLFNQ